MRSDIIDEILSVEDHAQKLVKDAQSKSRTMVMEAQAKADQTVHDGVQKQKEADRVALEKAEADADAELASFRSSFDAEHQIDAAEVGKVADEVVRLVCRTPLQGAEGN